MGRFYLETERFYIRQWEIDDAEELQKIMSDCRVHTYTGDLPWTIERTIKYINLIKENTNMIERIAFNLGRNDEEPNIDLAIELSNSRDSEGIKEIVNGLKNKKEQIANDCIKVLYEIGERNPELIAEYVLDFIQLLKSRNNRLVWGGMTAISKITFLKPKDIYENIEVVIRAYDNGSVITRDNSISVFAELAKADKKYEKNMLKRIVEHLETCRPKEVGQHAERAFICINEENSREFVEVLLKRKEYLSDSQKKRVEKLIKKIESGKFNS